ncbi:hypothetical protein MTO96_044066 [Rhipicephalus appendiculatus]
MPNVGSNDMVSSLKQRSSISVLTPDYMTLLQSLCAISKPSVNDVTAIFKEFRRSLDTRRPKSSSTPPTPSSRASKKYGGTSGKDRLPRYCVSEDVIAD